MNGNISRSFVGGLVGEQVEGLELSVIGCTRNLCQGSHLLADDEEGITNSIVNMCFVVEATGEVVVAERVDRGVAAGTLETTDVTWHHREAELALKEDTEDVIRETVGCMAARKTVENEAGVGIEKTGKHLQRVCWT